MDKFHIDVVTFGQFSGLYYIGYAVMHIPIGLMLDRIGPRIVMTGCILLTVLGLSPLLFAEHWIYPLIGRFLIGMGSSAAILGVFKIIRITFGEKRFPRMLSLSVTIGLIGAIYGGGPVNYMLSQLGYHAVITTFAVVGVFLAALTYWIIPNMTTPHTESILSDLKEVLGNRQIIGSCICAGLMVGPLEGFADVWGTSFLKITYGFEGTLAASLPSLIFIGMCFGSPLLNWIAEKVGYHRTIICSGIAMGLSFFLIVSTHLTPALLGVVFIVVGVCCSYQILSIYQASTYSRESVAGLTTAVANMIIMTFGYAFHTAISSVINLTGGPSSPEALTYGTLVIPITLCLGSAGYIVLSFKERKHRIT
jgi:predicted MFS family arabinose efflux permease